jgi:hypothetical protein
VQDPLAKPLGITLAATCKLDNPYGDSFALASGALRQFKCTTGLIERSRHCAQRLGIEYRLASNKWKENAHPAPITAKKDSRLVVENTLAWRRLSISIPT